MNADGGNARHVADSFTPARWSPDGSLVYFYGTRGLAAVDAAGGDRRVSFMPEEFWPQARDIAWLAYIEQYDGAYHRQGGADWQVTR